MAGMHTVTAMSPRDGDHPAANRDRRHPDPTIVVVAAIAVLAWVIALIGVGDIPQTLVILVAITTTLALAARLWTQRRSGTQ